MPCYSPLKGVPGDVNENGKRPLIFDAKKVDSHSRIPVLVPCGQCIGCRLEYSRQWAMRCMDEAQMHSENSFITLTYNEANLPVDKSLNKVDFQLFMKRLRKNVKKNFAFTMLENMVKNTDALIIMLVSLGIIFQIVSLTR